MAAGVKAPRDVLGPDLPDDPGPQRVVEIGDQSLLGCPARDQRRQQRPDHRGMGERVGKAGGQFGLDIPPLRRGRELVEPLRAADCDAVGLRQPAAEIRHRAAQPELLRAALVEALCKQRGQRKRRWTHDDRLRAPRAGKLVLEAFESQLRALDDLGDIGSAPSTEPAKAQSRIDVGPLDHDRDRIGG